MRCFRSKARTYIQGDSEKNTLARKIAISQKRVKIFAPNFAHLFRIKVRLSVLLYAIFTLLTPK